MSAATTGLENWTINCVKKISMIKTKTKCPHHQIQHTIPRVKYTSEMHTFSKKSKSHLNVPRARIVS